MEHFKIKMEKDAKRQFSQTHAQIIDSRLKKCSNPL